MLKKVLIVFVLSLSIILTGIGYAELSDELSISGSAINNAQKGVFISDVTHTPSTGTDFKALSYTSTILNSRVTLAANGTSTKTITVHLYNNSDYGYAYNGMIIGEGTDQYDNENIVISLSGLNKGDTMEPHTSRSFDVIFSYDNKSNITNTILNSIVKFEFVLESEYIPEFVASNATDRFKEILDSQNGFNDLLSKMEAYDSSNRNDSSYIGNVFGATTSDSTYLNEIFKDKNGNSLLTLNIGGEPTDVTIMIKRENLDGDNTTGHNGEEMTIYMTSEHINFSMWQSRTVQVFAAVFTKNPGSDTWTQLGVMYEGEASANNYSGSIFANKNSFNTDTWESTVVYYGAGVGSDISAIISAYKATQ